MSAERTTDVVERYLIELADAPGETLAEPIVRLLFPIAV